MKNNINIQVLKNKGKLIQWVGLYMLKHIYHIKVETRILIIVLIINNSNLIIKAITMHLLTPLTKYPTNQPKYREPQKALRVESQLPEYIPGNNMKPIKEISHRLE